MKGKDNFEQSIGNCVAKGRDVLMVMIPRCDEDFRKQSDSRPKEERPERPDGEEDEEIHQEEADEKKNRETILRIAKEIFCSLHTRKNQLRSNPKRGEDLRGSKLFVD